MGPAPALVVGWWAIWCVSGLGPAIDVATALQPGDVGGKRESVLRLVLDSASADPLWCSVWSHSRRPHLHPPQPLTELGPERSPSDRFRPKIAFSSHLNTPQVSICAKKGPEARGGPLFVPCAFHALYGRHIDKERAKRESRGRETHRGFGQRAQIHRFLVVRWGLT